MVDAAGDAGRQVQGRGGGVERRILVRGASGRGGRRRRHRHGRGRARLGRARLRPRDQSARRRRPDARLGVDGHGPGAVRGNAVSRRACRCAPICSTTACRPSSNRRPSMRSIVEAPDPNGPFGAKEAGEGSLSGFLPALTNAIADAIGVRLTELPASPDRLLEAITANRRAARLRKSRRPRRAPRRRPRMKHPPTPARLAAPRRLASPFGRPCGTAWTACAVRPRARRARSAEAAAAARRQPARARHRGRHRPPSESAPWPRRAADPGRSRRHRRSSCDHDHVPRARRSAPASRWRGSRRTAQIRGVLPVLAEAAATVAGPGHRTVATLGGNLCLDTRCVFYNQSEWWRRANEYCLKHGGDTCHVAPQGKHCHAAFSGDLAPALIVLGAEVEIVGPRGVRRLPLADLYVDDGAAHLALGAGRDSSPAFAFPRSRRRARAGYRKARARGAIDFPLAGVAARVEMRDGRIGGLRVALTGHQRAPVPARRHGRARWQAARRFVAREARQAGAKAGEPDADDGHALQLSAAGGCGARATTRAGACGRRCCEDRNAVSAPTAKTPARTPASSAPAEARRWVEPTASTSTCAGCRRRSRWSRS